MKKLAIGIDIGGTRTKSGLVDLEKGIVLETIIIPNRKERFRKVPSDNRFSN